MIFGRYFRLIKPNNKRFYTMHITSDRYITNRSGTGVLAYIYIYDILSMKVLHQHARGI